VNVVPERGKSRRAEKPSSETSAAAAAGSGVPAACSACGAASFAERAVVSDLHTATCQSCGLIFAVIERSEPPVPEFALVDQDRYLRSVGETRRLQARPMLRTLLERVHPGATLLDVGCSFGFFLDAARQAGFQIRGLEPDRQAHAYARRLLGDGVVRNESLEPGTVPARSADVVSTLDVVEHIPPEQHASFAKIVRETLTARGVWVIKVPSTEGLYYKLSDRLLRLRPEIGESLVRRLWQTRYEYPHLVYFSRRSLSTWLDRSGFSVLAHRYVQEVPTRTAVDRLMTDGDIGRLKAYIAAPAVFAVNVVEWMRRRSDSLVVFATPRR
jgi:cyclopropane fatty-acyl-phospholipid synthase-like methyltransferase